MTTEDPHHAKMQKIALGLFHEGYQTHIVTVDSNEHTSICLVGDSATLVQHSLVANIQGCARLRVSEALLHEMVRGIYANSPAAPKVTKYKEEQLPSWGQQGDTNGQEGIHREGAQEPRGATVHRIDRREE